MNYNLIPRMCANVIIKVLFLEILVATVTCDGMGSNVGITRNDRSPRQISLLEDEMCLGNFDVSEGSIIRTHDSQKLGAKYLNETDEGQGIKARDECFLLCCRTQHCNVAVFEEKVSHFAIRVKRCEYFQVDYMEMYYRIQEAVICSTAVPQKSFVANSPHSPSIRVQF